MSKLMLSLTKRKYLMNRLLRLYSLFLVGIILATTLALCIFTADYNYKKLTNEMTSLENRINNYVVDKDHTMSYLYMELASSNAAIDNVRKYLNLSSEEYFAFTQKYWEDYQKDTRVSATISGFFTAFTDLEELSIRIEGSEYYIKLIETNIKHKKYKEN